MSIKGNFLRIVVIVDVANIRVLGETKLGRKEIDNFASKTDGPRTVVSSGLVLVTTHSLPKQTCEATTIHCSAYLFLCGQNIFSRVNFGYKAVIKSCSCPCPRNVIR